MILSLGIWEEEDNIAIDRNIPCVVYTYMPMTGLAKKKDGASKYEVTPEPASGLSSDERGDAEVVEVEMVDFIEDYSNDEDKGTIEIPPYSKRTGEIVRAEKGGYFNEALEKSERHKFNVSENE